jgi:hypothetical protein
MKSKLFQNEVIECNISDTFSMSKSVNLVTEISGFAVRSNVCVVSLNHSSFHTRVYISLKMKTTYCQIQLYTHQRIPVFTIRDFFCFP